MQPAESNRLLADLLHLQNREPLHERILIPGSEVKFVVFVPTGHEEAVVKAIAQGGGGIIGNYSHCTFRSTGTGTYQPLEGANPWAGKVGRLENAEETRMETRVPRARIAEVMARVRAVHPYEEMAYDIYPLEELRPSPEPCAYIGDLQQPLSLRALQSKIRTALGKRVAGPQNLPKTRFVARIACCLGASADVMLRAAAKKPDLIITETDQMPLSSNPIACLHVS